MVEVAPRVMKSALSPPTMEEVTKLTVLLVVMVSEPKPPPTKPLETVAMPSTLMESSPWLPLTLPAKETRAPPPVPSRMVSPPKPAMIDVVRGEGSANDDAVISFTTKRSAVYVVEGDGIVRCQTVDTLRHRGV